jgi:hypothetical protein
MSQVVRWGCWHGSSPGCCPPFVVLWPQPVQALGGCKVPSFGLVVSKRHLGKFVAFCTMNLLETCKLMICYAKLQQAQDKLKVRQYKCDWQYQENGTRNSGGHKPVACSQAHM